MKFRLLPLDAPAAMFLAKHGINALLEDFNRTNTVLFVGTDEDTGWQRIEVDVVLDQEKTR